MGTSILVQHRSQPRTPVPGSLSSARLLGDLDLAPHRTGQFVSKEPQIRSLSLSTYAENLFESAPLY